MQVQLFEFDSLKLKLDAIQPDKIRRKQTELKEAALRLDMLEESLRGFQHHSDECMKSFEQSLESLHKVCLPAFEESNRSVDAYAFDVLSLTHELSKDRDSKHASIEAAIGRALDRNWADLLDESDLRMRKFEDFHERAKDRLQSVIRQFNCEQEERHESDKELMHTIGKYFIDSERSLIEGSTSTINFKEMLSEFAVSVAMELRECKEERQPVQKLIYDQLSALCDHLRDNLQIE